MIKGILHSPPPHKHPSILKLKLRIDRSTPDQHLDLSGFCIAAREFGAAPRLCLVHSGTRQDIGFSDAPSNRQGKRFGHVSLNAGACNLPDIRIPAGNLPAELVLISEDGTQTATLARFDYDPVWRLHDRLFRQHQADDVDPDALQADLQALPEASRQSEEGILLAAILNVIQHGYQGSGELELITLRRAFRKGEFGKFNEYKDLLNLVIAPHAFGKHGLSIKFADFDATPEFWTALREFLALLNAEFGPSFLVSGSLLGLVRDGGLLPHDDDIDMAIVMPARNAEEAADQWRRIRRDLSDRGLLHEGLMDATIKRPILKPVRIGGIPADLFPAWIEGGKVFVYPHTFGELKKADLLPLARDPHYDLPIPRRPEKMLAVNYGEGWKVPDPDAKLDWNRWDQNFEAFNKRVDAFSGC